MAKDGLMTEREQLIRRVAVEWFRWNLHCPPYSKDWDLRDVRHALILNVDTFLLYAKYHCDIEFKRQEVQEFWKNWKVGGSAID